MLGGPTSTRHAVSQSSRTPSSAGARAARPRFPAPAPARGRSGKGDAAAIDRVLAYTPYVAVGSARRREVALSFDDGPSIYTRPLLAVLLRERVLATFFEVGIHVSQFSALTRMEVRNGFAIGDHTEDHPFMAALSAPRQRAELLDQAAALRSAGAPFPRLFRPPSGSFDATTLTLLGQLRLLMVLWTVDTEDYARPGVARIVYTALSGARPGAIILMHDGGGDRSQTVAALPRIIRGLRRRGYRLVTVPQLMADDPPARDQPSPRPLSGA